MSKRDILNRLVELADCYETETVDAVVDVLTDARLEITHLRHRLLTPTDPEGSTTDTGNLLEAAWVLIANASNSNWAWESKEWQEAARTWRSRYFSMLNMPKMIVSAYVDLNPTPVINPTYFADPYNAEGAEG